MKKAFLIALILSAAGHLSAVQRDTIHNAPDADARDQGHLLAGEDTPYRSIFSTQLDNGPILNNPEQTLFA